jgi:hypothetical protein
VDLKREDCVLETSKDGCFVRLKFTSLVAGEVIAHFMVKEKSTDDKTMSELEAKQVSQQRFAQGSAQAVRLFLCEDLAAGLKGYDEKAKDRHHLVIDLKAETIDPRAVTWQRSCLKLSSESQTAQVTQQKVQCGTAVRKFEALYGTLPNPRMGARASENSGNDAEGGECVICLSKPREVAILHCRHVCLCRGCATITSSTWSFQCPVCRGRVAAMTTVKE